MYDKLIAAGAQVVAGDVILGRKVVGRWVRGNFISFPEADDVLAEIAASQEQPEAPAEVKPVAKKAAKKKEVVREEDPADPLVDPLAGLDLP